VVVHDAVHGIESVSKNEAVGVVSTAPKLSPSTDTIVPPEFAEFTGSRFESTGASHEKPLSLVPTTALTTTA
jgi:hypothetical protein